MVSKHTMTNNYNKTELAFDGIWKVVGHPHETSENLIELPGTVPGQIHIDLFNNGNINDPFWREQAEQCQWVENYDWCYRKEFVLPGDFGLEWQMLECDGLDTFASIRINGIEIGQADNMFILHRFDVTDKLMRGKNTLEVYFKSHKHALADKPASKYFQCFSNDRVFARKMQCGFGWDWLQRLVTCGIWRPIKLISYSQARIEDVYISTVSAQDEQAEIKIELSLERRTKQAVNALIVLKNKKGEEVLNKMVTKVSDSSTYSMSIKSPELWWPNGHGSQPLYTCDLILQNQDGDILDKTATTFGIRTIELDMTPDDEGCSFIVKINNRSIFCKGSNWVPADPFPSQITPDKYERLISQASRANINMLRCWGGGIYEPQEFWDCCNRQGIMVIQDFLLACAQYPQDDLQFMKQLEIEFGAAIKILRNNPALIIWSGDNELGMNDKPHDDYPGKEISSKISGPLCRKLDPSRPFIPTSPWGGNNNNDPAWGDSHTSAWYNNEFLFSDMQDYRQQISASAFRFASESAIVGAPPLSSLRKFMSEEDIFGPDKSIWEYRTKDNPYNGIDELTHYDMLVKTAKQLYGTSDNKMMRLRHMEYVQCEWIRLAMESARRRKFYCGGLLFWMYNDCWPASGWSVIDYYGFAKAGFYGMKRACAAVIAAMNLNGDKVELWICNDLNKDMPVHYRLYIQPFSSSPEIIFEGTTTAMKNASLKVQDFLCNNLKRDAVLICDISTEKGSARTVYYPGPLHDNILPRTKLHVTQKNNGSSGTVKIETDKYARVVTLEGDLDFSDNYFDMVPGENREISWTCPAGSFDGMINVICWNQIEQKGIK